MQFLSLKQLLSLFMWLALFLSLLGCIAEATLNLTKNSKFPAVFVFGDSVVDTGNNNYIKTLIKINYPPYGKDFMGGKPTGRYSDGKVPADLVAEELGIKSLLPPYLDPSLQAQDLLTGVNFAFGGAGYDPLTSGLVSVLSLSDQVELFKDYISKLLKIVGEERTSSIISQSLIGVICGSNDITNTYFLTALRSPYYDIASYTNLLIGYASSFVQDLYRLGGRRIGVFGLPPLGCLPSQRTLKGGLYKYRRQTLHGSITDMQFLCLKRIFPSIIWYALFLPLLGCIAEAALNRPIKFPAVIVFGDSVVDTGNNNYINTLTKVNYPPYGKDFMGGKPTGRFSDGKVPADLVAEELGIKSLLPPYLDPSLQAQDLLTGVNFASGGAGYDPITPSYVSVLSLSDQVELFKDYILKLQKIVGEERTSSIISQGLIGVICGSNDITNTYFSTALRSPYYDIVSYTDLLIGYASSFVQDLYRLGGRKIGVFSLPPLGCLPSQRTVRGGPERKCYDLFNQVAESFNKKLKAELNSINSRLPEARAIYIDIYNPLLDLIHSPQKYGFKVSDLGCCGTGRIEVTTLCEYAKSTCPNASEYVFWDSFHPTERAYRLLVQQLLKQSINSFT